MPDPIYIDPATLDVEIVPHRYPEPLDKLCEACQLRPATHWIEVRICYVGGLLSADLCAECLLKNEDQSAVPEGVR